jgi:hypothetical protein
MYRKLTTRPLPPSAVLLDAGKARLKSGKIVELNRNGHIICQSSKFYARINGREVALETSKRESAVREAELRAIEPLQEKGLIIAPRNTPERLLRDLTGEWLAELEHAGRNKGHIAKLRSRIGKILSLSGLEQLSELVDPTSSGRITRAMGKLRIKKTPVDLPAGEEFTPAQVRHLFALSESGLNKFAKSHGISGNGRAGKAKRYTRSEVEKIVALKSRGLSPNSINGHAVATGAFCNWLRKRGLLE